MACLFSPCAARLPTVKGDITILADSGIRNGLDVVRMIALGADSVLLGRIICTRWRPTARPVANLLN